MSACELGAEAFDWRKRRAAPRGGERYRTGVGVACGAHKNGILSETFTDFSTMTAKMNEDGSVALTASMHEMGAGVLTVMQLIVAEELGIGVDHVSGHRGRQRRDAVRLRLLRQPHHLRLRRLRAA